MQYFIGINQKALVEISRETGVQLDLVDAAIIDFVAKYSHTGDLQVQVIDGKIYYWISYQKIIEENPLLNISNKEVIGRRIAEIIKAKIFVNYVDRKQGSKTFIAFGENYKRIVNWKESITSDLTTQKSVADDSKVGRLTTQKSNNQYTSNQSTKSENKKEKKEKKFDAEKYIENLEIDLELKENLISLVEVRKTKKTPTTQKAIDLIITKLKSFDFQTQIKMVQNSIMNGWTGIFEIKEELKRANHPQGYQRRVDPTQILPGEKNKFSDIVSVPAPW